MLPFVQKKIHLPAQPVGNFKWDTSFLQVVQQGLPGKRAGVKDNNFVVGVSFFSLAMEAAPCRQSLEPGCG
jgi:hypothetical protein